MKKPKIETTNLIFRSKNDFAKTDCRIDPSPQSNIKLSGPTSTLNINIRVNQYKAAPKSRKRHDGARLAVARLPPVPRKLSVNTGNA